VGIDPAKDFVDCAFVNELNQSIGKTKRFKQTMIGYHSLIEFSKDKFKGKKIVYSIECSCRLWVKLASFLIRRGEMVVMFSPLNTYHNRTGINLSYSHTDPKDALIIASCTRDGKFNFYRELDDKHQIPRNLSIHYEKITHDLTRAKNRIRSKIDELFPEFFASLNLDTLTSIYLLENYFLPEHYIDFNIIKEAEIISKLSNRNYGLGILRDLRKAAETSVGVPISQEREFSERLIITSLIDQLKILLKQQQAFSNEIVKYYSDTNPFKVIISVTGISKHSAARFLAECSGIERFEHYKQLEKYAGASLRLNDSGNKRGSRRLSKIGNKRLLKILYFMLSSTSRYVPEIRIKYLKRQLQKPCYKKNLFACLPNLLKLIFSLIKDDKPYEINHEREKIVKELNAEYKKTKPKEYDNNVVPFHDVKTG
jgi:transposase